MLNVCAADRYIAVNGGRLLLSVGDCSVEGLDLYGYILALLNGALYLLLDIREVSLNIVIVSRRD